ncbi:MAG: hypothetical protein AAF206_03460 [Bacteroidota bacterium]
MNCLRMIVLGFLLSAGSLWAQQKGNVYIRANSVLNQSTDFRSTSFTGIQPSIMFEKGHIRHQVELGGIAFRSNEISTTNNPNNGRVANASLSLRYQFDYLFRKVEKGWSPYLGVSVGTSQNWGKVDPETPGVFNRNSYYAALSTDLVLGVKLPIGNRFQLNLETFANLNRGFYTHRRFDDPSLSPDLQVQNVFQNRWLDQNAIGLRLGLAFKLN